MTRLYRVGGMLCIVAMSAVLCCGAVAAGEGISAEQAKEIALAQTGGGEVVEMERRFGGGGVNYYRIMVFADDGPYHVEVDADTGKLLQFIRKHGYKGYKRRGDYIATPPAAGVAGGAAITREQAMAIALGQTNGGTVVDSDVDVKKRGRIVYEFEIIKDGVKYEIEIDDTGAIVDFERKGRRRYLVAQPVVVSESGTAVAPSVAAGETGGSPVASAARIAAEAAQAMAREKVGGGVVTEYKLETSGGRFFHEVVVVRDALRHRMEIDDASGVVRELSVRDAN